MKKEVQTTIVKYFLFTLVDIVVAMIFVMAMISGSSGDITRSLVVALLIAVLYPVLRGIASRIILKRILIPNLIFFLEVFVLPTLLTGKFSDFISPNGLFMATLIFTIPTVSSVITAGVIGLARLFKS